MCGRFASYKNLNKLKNIFDLNGKNLKFIYSYNISPADDVNIILNFGGKKLRNNLGEERVIGSTAYELFLVAYGSMQFAISGFANVWDFAASIIIIQEAGGEIYYLDKEKDFKKFICWDISHDKTKSIENLRRWKGLILAGNPNIVNFISKNIKKKKKLGIF